MSRHPTFGRGLLTLTALAATTLAQTFTSCNPLNVTCPDDAALGTSFNQTFGASSSLSDKFWNITGTPAPTFDSSGSAYTVAKKGEAPLVQSNFYMLGGTVSVLMKAAPGAGIVSSIVLISDDLDEIDWEVIGNNLTHVSTNYYGKGNTLQMNALWYPSAEAPQDGMHNYTIDWSSDKIEWIYDGAVVRTLTPEDAIDPDGKTMFPQTPMQLRIGNWAGGDSTSNWTVAWAGGPTDYSKAPFTMEVASAWATDGTSNASSYSYGDHTGTWQSIKVQPGQSSFATAINAGPTPSLASRWSGLSSGAQIAVAAVAGGVALALVALFLVCCLRSRRAGRRERETNDAAWEKEQIELLEYKRMMGNGGFGAQGGGFNQGYGHGQSAVFDTGYGNGGPQQQAAYYGEQQGGGYQKQQAGVMVQHYR